MKITKLLSIFLIFLILSSLNQVLLEKPIIKSAYATPDWYDTDYLYRKQHNITYTSAGSQTNYQIQIYIYNITGTDSGNKVYLGSKVQDSFNDIRFTDSDKITPLSYWTEQVYNTNASVWVKIPSIPASGNATIYLYYGYSNAINASSGKNTFIMFDDFTGSSLNSTIWNSGGTVTVSNNTVILSSSGAYIQTKTSYTYKAYKANVKLYNIPSQNQYQGWISSVVGGGGTEIIYATLNAAPYMDYQTSVSGSYTQVFSGSTYFYGNYQKYEVLWSSGRAIFKVNDSQVSSITTNIPSVSRPLSFVDYATANLYLTGWVFIRNYVYPEPANGAWGLEEIVTVYLTIKYHTGISSVRLNGTIVSNSSETSYSPTQISNITSLTNTSYIFRYYNNSGVLIANNPYYLLLSDNITINSYAIAPVTTTTTELYTERGSNNPMIYGLAVIAVIILILLFIGNKKR